METVAKQVPRLLASSTTVGIEITKMCNKYTSLKCL